VTLNRECVAREQDAASVRAHLCTMIEQSGSAEKKLSVGPGRRMRGVVWANWYTMSRQSGDEYETLIRDHSTIMAGFQVGPGRYCAPRHRMQATQHARLQSVLDDLVGNGPVDIARHVIRLKFA